MTDDITVENVEETVKKAIQVYWDRDMMIDAMFWKHCLPLLKQKWQKEVKKETK